MAVRDLESVYIARSKTLRIEHYFGETPRMFIEKI